MRTASPRRHVALLLAILAALALGVFAGGPVFDPDASPHDVFRKPGQCPKCHAFYKGELEPERFIEDADAFCLGCHSAEALGRSHPRNVRPGAKYWKMKVPDDFRLDDGGRIMCLTCHVGHGAFVSTAKPSPAQKPENPYPSKGTPYYYKTFFLRRSDPVQGFAPLCDGCHKYL